MNVTPPLGILLFIQHLTNMDNQFQDIYIQRRLSKVHQLYETCSKFGPSSLGAHFKYLCMHCLNHISKLDAKSSKPALTQNLADKFDFLHIWNLPHIISPRLSYHGHSKKTHKNIKTIKLLILYLCQSA